VKACPACGRIHDRNDWTCPFCQRAPVTCDGIPVFGSSVAAEPSTDADYLDAEIRHAEASHFWFRSRRALVEWALGKYFRGARQLLDVGCGTGFVLAGLGEKFPELARSGCDVRIETLKVARREVSGVSFLSADTATLPYSSEFDVVIALDVLEHIDDDRAALDALRKVLKPAGGLILTVPQHPWLWSAVDDFSCHRRRYVRADLESKVRAAGFETLRCTSFFAVTLPLLAASRLRRTRGPFDPRAELLIPKPVNAVLGALSTFENWLIQIGVSLPVGSSLMLIGRSVQP
jgi:SAM-dependent methyltransferase